MTAHTKAHGKHGDFAIEAKGLVKRFKSGKSFIEVLKGVDFDARHGDLTMVMGPSGSGKSTLIAALSGLGLVVVFMVAAYGLFGVFAMVALFINMVFIFAFLSLLQATLTLPGIAGIVLSIGMAVDANVLIYERMREEMRTGRSVMAIIDAGYSRAMSAIIDSNITSLIACLLLYAVGTGPVRGFAVTLGIGITASMFTAIMVTRLMIVTWMRQTRPKTVPL
jgi:preprotein translocase subunit SecD